MIIFIFIIIFILILLIYNLLNKKELIDIFNSNNVIVFGKKGTGKDVLFDLITSKRKFYYSNVPYTNSKFELVTPNDLNLSPNNFENLLNDNITKIKWNFIEKTDFFISDCGVYLPSQYDYLLHKKYSSLPLLYALSRHIGLHNIHCNAQNLERIWKPLREQADYYIKCLKIIKLPFFLILKYRIYDKYSSACSDIRTIKSGILGASDVLKVHNASYGMVKEKSIILFKHKIKYNSRYFKDLFILEEPKPNTVGNC